MGLRPEAASKNEIQQLKSNGVLGKRAPSCSLLNIEDTIRLVSFPGK